jgi:hypothetical protein
MPIKQCMHVMAHEMVSRARERVRLLGTQKVLLQALDTVDCTSKWCNIIYSVVIQSQMTGPLEGIDQRSAIQLGPA